MFPVQIEVDRTIKNGNLKKHMRHGVDLPNDSERKNY